MSPILDQIPCPVLVTDRGGRIQLINQNLLQLVGGTTVSWLGNTMSLLLPKASQIFLQTHVWPMLLRENQVREIRLQILDHTGKQVPVFVNCQKSMRDAIEQFTWVFFVTIERIAYERKLLEGRQKAEEMSAELAKSARFIRMVADALPSMIGYWDTQLLCQFANNSYLDWFGRTAQEMIGLPMPAVLGASLFEQNLPHIHGALAGVHQEFERTIVKPDGSAGYVLANYVPDINLNGQTQGFFALLTDISRLKEADAASRLSASVFDAATEGIIVTDAAATVVSVNPAFTKLTGYTSAEIIGKSARILKSGRHDADFFSAMYQELHSTKLWNGEIWNKRKDGSIYLERLCISAICDDTGAVYHYVGICADITERWHKEQVIQHLALHDSLTGLPNRSLLMERIGQLIAMAAREPRRIALMLLDLDGFKFVNDTWGHEAGDQVLKTVSSRLSALLRPCDTVARLGGDEFVILLDNPENQDNVAMIASRVIDVINAPMNFDEKAIHVGASIGIAFFTQELTSSNRLLKSSDDAMYEAKAAGKNTFRFAD